MPEKKSLRVLLFENCNRSCEKCCNLTLDLEGLPVIQEGIDYRGYDEVILTGGEPLLRPDIVQKVALEVYRMTSSPIYLYTAMSNPDRFLPCLRVVDGVTLTLHEQADVIPFYELCAALTPDHRFRKSFRLYAFKGVEVEVPDWWTASLDRVWLDDCPLPSHETLFRLPQLYL